jgi:hypothetical protein
MLVTSEIGISVAQFDLHGKTCGIAYALNGRGRDHKNPRFGMASSFLFKPITSDRKSSPGPRLSQSFRMR